MKILVTGGAGFIGSNFIRHMIGSYPEYEVINFDLLTYAGNLENLADLEAYPNYRFIKGDICDRDLLEKIGFDAIVHFAAESHVDRSILDAARKRRCRMVHVSTDEVYGSIEEGSFHEGSPLMPNSPYAASKASSDLIARAYHETHGLDVVITRCSNNYGPYQFPEKLIPLVIANGLCGKPVPVYGDGLNVRDWLFVGDHCRAVDIAFHKGKAGGVYNIGGNNEQKNIDIVRKLLAAVARKTGASQDSLLGLITFVKDRPGHDRRYAIDPSKMEREFGWGPATAFDAGIEATVDWYLAHRPWWERIISGAYREYYELQYGKKAAG
jgi:dTDP-glucose 4,6-dehydratase